MLARQRESELVCKESTVTMARVEEPRPGDSHAGWSSALANTDGALDRWRAGIIGDRAPITELGEKRGHAYAKRKPCESARVAGVSAREQEQEQRTRPVTQREIIQRRPACMPLPYGFEARVNHRGAYQHRPCQQAHRGRKDRSQR